MSQYENRLDERKIAETLYARIVEQALQGGFYRSCGIPDQPEYRLELIAIHSFLLLYGLKSRQEEGAGLAAQLFKNILSDVMRLLNSSGIPEGVANVMAEDIARGIMARILAYDAAFNTPGPGNLEAVLKNFLFKDVTPRPGALKAMADYIGRESTAISGQPFSSFLAGQIAFGQPPELK